MREKSVQVIQRKRIRRGRRDSWEWELFFFFHSFFSLLIILLHYQLTLIFSLPLLIIFFLSWGRYWEETCFMQILLLSLSLKFFFLRFLQRGKEGEILVMTRVMMMIMTMISSLPKEKRGTEEEKEEKDKSEAGEEKEIKTQATLISISLIWDFLSPFSVSLSLLFTRWWSW